jgi:hypothetical protein
VAQEGVPQPPRRKVVIERHPPPMQKQGRHKRTILVLRCAMRDFQLFTKLARLHWGLSCTAVL